MQEKGKAEPIRELLGQPMTNVTISTCDLQILLDIAEGYTSENGLEAISRYTVPSRAEDVMEKVRATINRNITGRGDTPS